MDEDGQLPVKFYPERYSNKKQKAEKPENILKVLNKKAAIGSNLTEDKNVHSVKFSLGNKNTKSTKKYLDRTKVFLRDCLKQRTRLGKYTFLRWIQSVKQ